LLTVGVMLEGAEPALIGLFWVDVGLAGRVLHLLQVLDGRCLFKLFVECHVR
jgi:hypothetical protein